VFTQEFKIIDGNVSNKLLLGIDFCLQTNLRLNFLKRTVKLGENIRLKMDPEFIQSILRDEQINVLNNEIVLNTRISLPGRAGQRLLIPPRFPINDVRTLPHIIEKGLIVRIVRSRIAPKENQILILNKRRIPVSLYVNQRIASVHERTQPVHFAKTHVKETHDQNFTGNETVTDKNGVPIAISKSLPIHSRKKVLEVVYSYRHLFTTKTDEIKMARCPPYEIRLRDHNPVARKPYNLAIKEKEDAMKLLKDLQKAGLIRRSNSPWNSPGFLKYKKDKTPRLVCDYRLTNEHLEGNFNTSPSISSVLDVVSHAKYFINLDLASGYFQIPLTEKSKEITAFCVSHESGQFEYNVLPMGLKPSGGALTSILYNIFHHLLFKGLCIYCDDLTIYSDSIDGALTILKEVFRILEAYQFTLKTNKAVFFEPSLTLLGYQVSSGKISPTDENILAVKNLNPPTDQSN
jgi:hypothetical protein